MTSQHEYIMQQFVDGDRAMTLSLRAEDRPLTKAEVAEFARLVQAVIDYLDGTKVDA